jgi:asparagine synthase (glutamine-hydrolysing)
MCGIGGKVDFAGPVDAGLLERMCELMAHRGPDERGVFTEDGVGLAVQRLAIIDVAGGQQPVFDESGDVVAVMNGEIYNHAELQAELEARGHRFASRVDTAVIPHLYAEHGTDMFERLRGMFAIALWDRRRRRLVLARDRVGKKPLFWARRGDRVWFASTVRALLADPEIPRDVDPRAIAAYLTLKYVPHPMSAFAALRKLAPASWVAIDADGEEHGTYWRLSYSDALAGLPREEVEARLRVTLRDAVAVRLESEVPLGAFLSGGIDSSAVVALMAEASSQPVRTFSIGFPDAEYDELRYAREVARRFGTEHHEFVVEPRAVDIMPELARHYGEPFADPSAIPSFYLAQLTKRHVTVALNGDGGDESFAGYPRYARARWVNRLEVLPLGVKRSLPVVTAALATGAPFQSSRSRAARVSRSLAGSPFTRYAAAVSELSPAERPNLLAPAFRETLDGWEPESVLLSAWESVPGRASLNHMLATDVDTYLPDDLLVKMDVASMAYSVEARSPLLDHHVMELAAQLPDHWKQVRGRGKRILASAMRDLLPASVLERPKMGFSVPLERWFREELRDLPREILCGADAAVRDYVLPDAMERLIREHQEGDRNHSVKLWTLVQLELWHREVVAGP